MSHQDEPAPPDQLPDRLDDNNDRISSLHDSILHRILSFLPAKDVVQTCLVSKRWKVLWKSHPYLDLGEFRFANDHSFMKFLHYFLHKRDNNSGIIRFYLSHCPDKTWDAFYIWSTPILSAGVQELHLKIYRGRSLPSCLFTINSLVTLKLEVEFYLRFPDVFCFPKLKNLYLLRITFAGSFISQLLRKSPNLENLIFRLCFLDKSCSSSCSFSSLCGFSNMNEADLHTDFSNYVGAVGTFIRKFSNVRTLHLYNSCIKLLRCETNLWQHLPSFCNLKYLDVWLSAKEGDIRVMGCLVSCSPLLQYLRITFTDDNIDYWDQWMKKNSTGQLPAAGHYLIESLSLPRSLKWVRMREFGGQESQIELLKHLLRNDQFVEKIIVEVIKKQLLSLTELQPSTSTCVLDVRPRTWFDSFYGLRCL